VEVAVEALERGDVGAAAHARGLDDLRSRAARDLGAEGGPLVAVELDHAQPDRVGGGRHLVERRVDEDATDLRPSAQRRGDALGGGQRAATR
jgi:hypothetical protein